jgi:polysaccharide export outer membrane protein
MFRLVRLLGLLLLSSTALASDPAYILNPGDALQISVWREDSLQKEVRVLPDGSVTFPLVGRVDVGGVGTQEVEKRITAKLKDHFPDPVVTVVVTGIDGNRAYVLGKVPKPGPLIMTGPVTVLQALSMAGGLDKFADEGSIKVVRSIAGDQKILSVAYKDLISGRDMATNLLLKAGDTLIVP